MTHEELLAAVKRAVLPEDPGAEVILYGSRARGDARPDSDWDFLILLSAKLNEEEKDRIRFKLYETEWDRGNVIAPLFRTKRDYNERCVPLYDSVAKEGIPL